MGDFTIIHYIFLFVIAIIAFNCNERFIRINKIKRLINYIYESHGQTHNFDVRHIDENFNKLTDSLIIIKKEISFTKTIECEFDKVKSLRLLHDEYYTYINSKNKTGLKKVDVKVELNNLNLNDVGVYFVIKSFLFL